MSDIAIIKVHTISPEELHMNFAEFREYYEPSGLICLVFSSSEIYCIISIEKGNFYGLYLS